MAHELPGHVHVAVEAFAKFARLDHNMIAKMSWEETAMAPLGLSLDQFRFVVALLLALLISSGLSLFKSPSVRHLYASVTGLLLIYYPFGAGIVQAFPPVIVTWLVMALAPRHSGMLAWALNFPYLMCLHVLNASGENWNAGRMDFTGGVMVLVLKLISAATCRSDSFRAREELSEYQAKHVMSRLPSPLAWTSYALCCGNLLSGPCYEFVEYKDFMELQGAWDPKSARPMPPRLLKGVQYVAEAALYMAMYLSLSAWTVPLLVSDWFMAQPWYYKLVAMTLVAFTYQLRYYFSWKLSEASLTLAGFNWLGYAANGKAQWGRVRNIDGLGMWTADSARKMPLSWNIATSSWLRRYVYERVTPRGKKPGFAQLFITQLTSAVWHGVYPGYFLFFAGTALWIHASQVMYKAETHLPDALTGSVVYRAIKVAYTTMSLDYLASAFFLLDLKRSLQVYSSLRWAPHYVFLAMSLMGPLVRPKRTAKAGSGEAKKKQ